MPDDKSVSAGQVDNVDNRTPALGYDAVLHQRRSTATLLFQSLAISAPPFAIGTPLINAMYGGGPLSLFVGWLVVASLAQCVALSVAELASRYPTSAGPYYWSFQIATKAKVLVSFVTGWIWLTGNWTIALGVNFGFAQLIVGTATLYHPTWEATPWQLVLILWAIVWSSVLICVSMHRWLHIVDSLCAMWTAIITVVYLIVLLVQAKDRRHNASYAFGEYTEEYSGWGHFTFFIGLLPAGYTFAAVGMISSMAEETPMPEVKVPRAISLSVPTIGTLGLALVIAINFVLPPMEDVMAAPYTQALPVVFEWATGSPSGGVGLMALLLVLSLFCSISVTTAASRCTWAFSRDKAVPLWSVWSRVTDKGIPLYALLLVAIVQMLLGCINLGSSSAFTAFVSVGVIALSVSYLIPVAISLAHNRTEVNQARFHCVAPLGTFVNCVALCWIAFQVVLFSMPVAIPTTPTEMNYASVVLVGFASTAFVWYIVNARKSKLL